MKQSVTEDEAKRKWCRHGTIAIGSGRTQPTTVNRKNYVGATTCLASDCMDWEWVDIFPENSRKDGRRKGRCGAES